MITAEHLLKPTSDVMMDGMALCLCKNHGGAYWQILEIFGGMFMVDGDRDEDVEIIGFVMLENAFYTQQNFIDE